MARLPLQIDLDNFDSDLVRKTIRQLSEEGITYSELASHTPPELDWTANAIKMLLRRGGQIRHNAKSEALIEAINRVLAIKVRGTTQSASDEGSKFEAGMNLLKTSKHIGNRFKSISEVSTNFTYATKLCFIRLDAGNQGVVPVLIETRHTATGCIFSMKLTGISGNRRIVVGDILVTLQNTYFSGLAYEVNAKIDDFVSFDAFNIDNVLQVTSGNEVGIESISVRNSDMQLAVKPANFQGLSGAGLPMTGTGAIIEESQFEFYGVDSEAFKHQQKSVVNPELLKLDKYIGFHTCIPKPSRKEFAQSMRPHGLPADQVLA